MKKILVLGATSSIAEHCARIWAQRGDRLFLVGRNIERLNTMTADLRVRGAATVDYCAADLNQINAHSSLLDQGHAALDGLDIVLIAHGTLSDQSACERSVDLALHEINTNALSVISLLTHVANRFEADQAGTIAVISSVAGDRGRASNYVYGSAKAMVTAFASGLRQRLHKCNVAVVTLKPGFVDTPMTAGLKKGLLWAKPDSVAKRIVNAIDQRKDDVYVPAFWWLIMVLIRHIPNAIFKKLKL